MKEITAEEIKKKAIELGYEKCGIINVLDVADYANKLKERSFRVFAGLLQFGRFFGLSKPQKKFPWAKSIIILVTNYSGYNVPNGFDGMYGKSYMFDGRLDKNSKEFKMRQDFTSFLKSEGLNVEGEPKFGITALRWAAYKAGIGIIRKNNFLYTENGSWNFLEALLVDRKMELVEKNDFNDCPDSCNMCIGACPTKGLSKPYTTSLFKCASFITTLAAENGMGVPSMKTAAKLGRCLYGCDICQSVCPYNKNKMTGGTDFPGLKEITEYMSPEKIMIMDYEEIERKLSNKYWYINPKYLWKWKINALIFMSNNFVEDYRDPINSGIYDKNKRVRNFAKRISKKIKFSKND